MNTPSSLDTHESSPRQSRRRWLVQSPIAIAGLAATASTLSATSLAATTHAQPPASTRPAGSSARRQSAWPDGIRLVISVSMQLEAGAQSEHNNGSPFPAMAEDLPDLPARTWFEYGAREGIPRLLDLWDRHHIKVTSHMVGRAVEANPQLARDIVGRGHEAAAHGYEWVPHWTMSAEAERASYVANIAAIEQATGTRPVGFNAYWMRGTPRTLGILQSLGFRYHIDDLSADEPLLTTVNERPFVIVPYTTRNNDISRFGAEGPMSAAAFGQDLQDEFDWLYEEGAHRRRMMSISTHDRISGTPARAKVLDQFIRYAKRHPGVVFMRKDEIADLALRMPDVPHKSV